MGIPRYSTALLVPQTSTGKQLQPNMSSTKSSAEDLLRSTIALLESGGAVESATDAARILDAAAEAAAHFPVTQHPLGFLHLDLSGLSERGAARLHLWTEEFMAKADPLGRLHDHTWELRSTVLVGELTDHVLTPVPDGRGEYLAHVVHYDATGNRVGVRPGRWRLDEVDVRCVRAGQSYRLAPRLVHRTEISVLPTATLVLPIERGGPGPIVFAPQELADVRAAPRTPIDPRAATSALRLAAECCEN
jgi:hypothetical protein